MDFDSARSDSPGAPPDGDDAFGPSAAAQLEEPSEDFDSVGAGSRATGASWQVGGGDGVAQRTTQQQQQQQQQQQHDEQQRQGLREYDPADYAHLDVSPEIRDLFRAITRYRPAAIDPPAPLKPFLPDYIPALGDTDDFVKVPRPDGRPDFLGLKLLDEPAVAQSDPSVLALQLRRMGVGGGVAAAAAGGGGGAGGGAALDIVGRVEVGAGPGSDAARAKAIDAWVASVTDVHRSRPSAAVTYRSQLPSVEALMQELPPTVETALQGMRRPGGDLDLDLVPYARLVCALLDVPVQDSGGPEASRALIEALHLLFVVLLEFRANPFFQAAAATPAGAPPSSGGGGLGGRRGSSPLHAGIASASTHHIGSEAPGLLTRGY